MSTLYNSKKLIPITSVTFAPSIEKSGDGEPINHIWKIQLNGTLLPYKGSPTSSGTFWTTSGYPPDEAQATDTEQRYLEAKVMAIQDLFSVEGKLLEFQPWDGGPQIKCNPRINSINFDNNTYVSDLNYTVDMEAPHLLYEGNFGSGYLAVPTIARYNVSQISENWNVELNEEEEFWTIKRDLSAKGDRVYDINGNLVAEPWWEARKWCLDQATSGVLPDFAANSDPLTSGLYGFVGYNYSRNSSPDKKNGTFALSETWVATSGLRPYIETFDVQYSRNNEEGVDAVSINGEIRGLDFTTRIPFAASGKLQQANLALSGIWSSTWGQDITYKRAKQHSEIWDLNPIPRSETLTKREKAGIISYQREYDNRPLNYITGSLVERIEIQDTLPEPWIRPIIVIPGRPSPLIQDIGSHQQGKRIVTATVIMDRRKEPYASIIGSGNWSSSLATIPRPNASGLLDLFKPIGVDGYDVTLIQNSEQWLPTSLKLVKTKEWVAHSI